MTSQAAKKARRKNVTHSLAVAADQQRGEQAVRALQVAQNNLINHIAELGEATPAHQTLTNLIIKDMLIIGSILFWPTVIYWLW